MSEREKPRPEKRKRIPSVGGESSVVEPKRQRSFSDDETPSLPPAPVQPDGSSFFKRITSAAKKATSEQSVHQGYRYSVGIAERYQGIKQPWVPGSDQNRVKPGHLTSDDYEGGYLSEEGDTLLKTIHTHKDDQIASIDTLESGPTSRSGNKIKIGKESTTSYHGVPIKFRVDFTEVEDKPKSTKRAGRKSAKTAEAEVEAQAPAKRWEPHARILTFDKNASTVELSNFAEQVGVHGEEAERQHFLQGVKGQAPPAPEHRDVFASGVQLRAVGRASDAFGQVFPAFDGLLLSKPESPEDVRNLFFNPIHKTGALGHQNSGVGATSDFNAFKEIVADQRVEHSTNKGTDIDSVSLIRKAKAINALAPIVDIEQRSKGK